MQTLDQKRAWAKKNKDKIKIQVRNAQLKRKYGITLEKYMEMLWLQNGHCFFCHRTPDEERYGVLCVDHDHKTGRVRGLLCITHNRAIGVLGDDEESLLKALNYVKG